jgi:hypothetical protein
MAPGLVAPARVNRYTCGTPDDETEGEVTFLSSDVVVAAGGEGISSS